MLRILAAIATASVLSFAVAVSNPEEYVNILGGTDSRYDLSHGNSLPLIARPWGFNSWAPMTDNDPTYSAWWFHPSDRRIFGIRCTHQPSPWISDYGNFNIMASLVDPAHSGSNQFSGYNPSKSSFHPYHFKTALLAYGSASDQTTVELTATSHGAIMQVHFPSYTDAPTATGFNQTRRISVSLNGNKDTSSISYQSDGSMLITGISTANSGGVTPNFAHHFAIAVYSRGDAPISDAVVSVHADNSFAYIDFDPMHASTDDITLRIATSFISADQALVSLKREIGMRPFDDILQESKREWRNVLSRADIQSISSTHSSSEQQDMLTTFYSTLYRASLFPRQLSEINADDEEVHWSPYDGMGNIYAGPLTTDSGFWDAYSTIYPYLSLLNRPALSTMLQGWLSAYKEGGWLPKWASPGYRGSMVGTMGDVALADAIVKNIPNFDTSLAYEAIRKDAFEAPPHNSSGVGRVCLPAYLQYGYIPHNAPEVTGGICDQVVSRSLNYMQSDYAIAQAARYLGYDEDYATLMERAAHYDEVFDTSTLLMRSRELISGKWIEPFDEFAWSSDYTEAGPWQYRFYVPYDPTGLAKLYAENGLPMCDALEKMMTAAPTFHLGQYSTEIHEQTELAVNCWGQYEHNNQPVHHVLYMFIGADEGGVTGSCAAKGQHYIRRVLSELYKPTPDMFAGDEDNGQMSAWYVLSSLGLYSLSPGSQELVFGSPLFERVRIALDAGELIIEATNNAAENVYVQDVQWNGVSVGPAAKSIAYSTLMQGGTLTFHMGAQPRSAKYLRA